MKLTSRDYCVAAPCLPRNPERAIHRPFLLLHTTTAFLLLLLFTSIQVSARNFFQAQGRQTVSGIVKDESGQPMESVSVEIRELKKGTQTNAAGNFTLPNIAPGDYTLRISFVGFEAQQQTIHVGNEPLQLQLALKSASNKTEETAVVVVGYGSQKRTDITGSVASMPKERLANLPVTNVLQSMEGSVAGINITSSSAAPGSTPSIYIRGLNSINASTAPLIVLDGLPFSGTWNDINSADVASVEILKDASATAIYGTRGSNGVILVTTKRGTSSKPTISYNGYAGTEFFTHKFEPMDGAAYAQKNLDYTTQTGSTPAPVPNLSELANYQAGKTTDWLKEVSRNGYFQNHELSIAGGSEWVKYYVAGAYLKEQGVLKGYQYNRASLRSNIDMKITSWLKAGANLMYVYGNNDGPNLSLSLASQASPYGQEYNKDGTYNVYPMNPETLYPNPMVELYNARTNRTKNYTGNFYAEVQPTFLKGLKYRLNFGTTSIPTLYQYYTTRASGDLLGTATVKNGSTNNWILENILTYDKQWKQHSLNITGLYSAQKSRTDAYNIINNTFINDQLTFYNLSAAQQQTSSSSLSSYSLVSQMLRINYGFASKYLLTLTARRDGYSGFGIADKYGTFPSAAVAWNIYKEDFMKSAGAVSQLKLRASYGTTGNQSVSPYQTLSTLAVRNYVYGQTTAIGLTASRMGNSDLKWESTSTLNLGIDFGLLNNRIGGTVEVYQSKTSNLLLSRQIPSISGYTSILDNIGATQNRGIEVTLNTHNIASKNFNWTTNLNFSANKNKITRLYGDNKDDIGNKWFIGKSLGAVYDYAMTGIWQQGDDVSHTDPTAKAGDIRFRDINGDGKINTSDRMYLGTTLPKWIGGITNTFSYKQFSLNVFIQTFQGAIKNNSNLNWADQAGRMNLPAGLPYWTAANKSNALPALSYTNSRSYGFSKNDSYTRIKDITFTYTVPQQQLEKYKLAALSFYVSGRNLHTFTNWFGWDPEVDGTLGSSGASTNYPNTGTVVVGINVGLK